MRVKPNDTPPAAETRDDLLALLDSTMRAAGAQRILYSAALAETVGLRQTDLECLFIITLNPGVTPGRLARDTGLTTGAVTGVLDRIQRAGFIRRVPDSDDRRRIRLEPVTERIAEIRDANRHMRELWMNELLDYSDAELRFLIDFARRNYRSAVAATAALTEARADDKASPARRRAARSPGSTRPQ